MRPIDVWMIDRSWCHSYRELARHNRVTRTDVNSHHRRSPTSIGHACRSCCAVDSRDRCSGTLPCRVDRTNHHFRSALRQGIWGSTIRNHRNRKLRARRRVIVSNTIDMQRLRQDCLAVGSRIVLATRFTGGQFHVCRRTSCRPHIQNCEGASSNHVYRTCYRHLRIHTSDDCRHVVVTVARNACLDRSIPLHVKWRGIENYRGRSLCCACSAARQCQLCCGNSC